MAVLLDLTETPEGLPTINTNFAFNPNRILFLTARFVQDKTSPGMGKDLVYRDPWGQPYVISFDLNDDEMTRDFFYARQKVSQRSGSLGFNRLTNNVDSMGNTDQFQARGRVMIWSSGPDRRADSSKPANIPPNADNICTWSDPLIQESADE